MEREIKISIDASGARRGGRTAEGALRGVSSQANRTNSRLGRLRQGLTGFRQSLFSVQSALGAVAGAAGLGYMIDRTLEGTQQLQKLSKQTGIGVERIQELEYAAQQAGVSQDRMRDSLGELAQRMGEAAADGGEMAEGFRAAGISLDGLASRNPSVVFNQIADAISNAESQSKALNIAVKTFGDESGRDMVAMLREGSDGLEDMSEKARELGLVLSQDTVEGGAAAARELDKIKQVLSTQFTKAIADLGPDITEFTSTIVDNTDEIARFADNMMNVAVAMGKAAGETANFVDEVGRGLGVTAAKLSGAGDPNDSGPSVQRQVQMRRQEAIEARRRSAENLTTLAGLPAGERPQEGIEHARKSIRDLNREIRNYNEFLGKTREQEQRTEAMGDGGGGTDGGGTPEPDPSGGMDIQAARQRADKFNQIWSDSFRELEQMEQASQQRRIDNRKELDEVWNQAQKDFARLEEKGTETANVMEDAFNGWANTFSSQLTNMVWESEFSFQQIAESFGKMVTRMAIQRATMAGFSAMGFGGGQAEGGVWSGGVQQFAKGGMVNSTTPFAMANGGVGVMGEKGAEAIMPVTRTASGDMGVKAEGGGEGDVILNVEVRGGEGEPQVSTEESRNKNGDREIKLLIDQTVAESVSKGGKTGKAIERTYGVKRSGTQRS